MSSDHPKTAVFVIGAGRSGTSTVARALQAVGVDLGDRFKKASRKNPTGFFEDKDLLAISKKARKAVGLRADSVRLIDAGVFDCAKVHALQSLAIDVIQTRFAHSPVWGFKYGRTLRILPFWDRILATTGHQPAYLIALRNPLSVARSRAKIDPRRGQQAVSDLEWLVGIVPFFRRIQGQRLAVVDYDALMDDPTAELERVVDQLKLPTSADSKKQIDAFVDEFLDTRLRHTRFGDDDLDAAVDINPIVKDAYRLLKTWTHHQTDDDIERFWAAWADIEARVEALSPVLSLLDAKENDWRRAVISPWGPLQSWRLIKPWFKQ
jgi:hypothetical protein